MDNQELIITLEKIKTNSLIFSVTLTNVLTSTEYMFYKGTLVIHEFIYDGEYEFEDKFIKIFNYTKKDISFVYEVEIGKLGKHGHQGIITIDWLTFSGENVFIFPHQLLCVEKPTVKSITLKFDEAKLNGIIQTKTIVSPTWLDVYNLMKSCYLFSNFIQVQTENVDFVFGDSFSKNERHVIIEKVIKIYNYYIQLFKDPIPKIIICFLDEMHLQESILGGASTLTIGATFSLYNKRDWQLLSHRLFHAFMDTHLPIFQLHLPPHVWITEGLASYYELRALDSMDKSFKDQLNFDYNETLNQIYMRYLYFKYKDEVRLKMSFMQEPYIKSAGRLEFLHYTQAPLIILFLEQCVGVENAVLEWLMRHKSVCFNLKDMIDDLLGVNSDSFASSYLFGLETIDLFDYFNVLNIHSHNVINDLNEFEYVLYSWFALEEPHYAKHDISYPNINKLAIFATNNQIHFDNVQLEEKIKEYNTTLYQLLLVHRLHLTVCGINFYDIRMRHFMLTSPYQVNRWKDFIKTIN